MDLQVKQCHKCNASFKLKDNSIITGIIYTYESHKKIYDILVLNNQQLVQTNFNGWSNRIDSWTEYHYAIKNHFSIE